MRRLFQMSFEAHLIQLQRSVNHLLPTHYSNHLEKIPIPSYNQWIRLERSMDAIIPISIEWTGLVTSIDDFISIDIQIGSSTIWTIPFSLITTFGTLHEDPLKNSYLLEIPQWLFFASNAKDRKTNKISSMIPIVGLIYHSIEYRIQRKTHSQSQLTIYWDYLYLENEVRKKFAQDPVRLPTREIEMAPIASKEKSVIFQLKAWGGNNYGYLIQVSEPIEKVEIKLNEHILFSLSGFLLKCLHGQEIKHTLMEKKKEDYQKKVKMISQLPQKMPHDIYKNILSFMCQEIPPEIYTYWIPIEYGVPIENTQDNIHTYLRYSSSMDSTIEIVFTKEVANGTIYGVGINFLQVQHGMGQLYYV